MERVLRQLRAKVRKEPPETLQKGVSKKGSCLKIKKKKDKEMGNLVQSWGTSKKKPSG